MGDFLVRAGDAFWQRPIANFWGKTPGTLDAIVGEYL
jgi:hypothetical protein